MLKFSFTELSVKVRELEKANKTLSNEKADAESEINSLKEKVGNSQKELKDIHSHRKQTMEEFSDLNDKLAEVRSQKLKLTRLVREKEEEIGMTISCLRYYFTLS